MKVRKLKTTINNTGGEKLADFRATINSLVETVEELIKKNKKLEEEIKFLKIKL